MNRHLISLLLLLLWLPDTWADDSQRTIRMAISFSIPPWVIQESDRGIEMDILKAALDEESYRIAPVYLPFARAYRMFEHGHIDGVINVREGVMETGHLSDEVVIFQNVAVSLEKAGHPETFPLAYLGNKEVVAFQNASLLLGDRFKRIAEYNSRYKEVAAQKLQINLLFVRNVDFIVMDRSIFQYYLQLLRSDQLSESGQQPYAQSYRIHPVFEPSPYRFLFRDATVRDDFNQGLRRIRESGEYHQIFLRYKSEAEIYHAPTNERSAVPQE